MKSMTNRLLTTISLLLISNIVLGAVNNFKVNSDLSTLSFATIKLEYVVEAAKITNISGQIDNNGILNIALPIKHIDTGIGLRNQRLNELFFNAANFPDAKVSAKLPEGLLLEDSFMRQLTLPAQVTIFGQTQELNFTVNILKKGGDIAVSTVQPTIVRAKQFGIPSDNLNALASTVGGIAISDSVPVSFSLILSQ